ncbi:MAG: tetratricopeptide repeat protein [Acidobacteria bacterium]|nr:tetratricopeptide repeat protein [Acidobacteriota bacterium]
MGFVFWFLCLSAAQAADVNFLIFPPENQATAALGWLAEGIALSVSEQIQVPGVKALDRDERLELLEHADLPPGLPLSMASMIRVGQLAAVDYVVTGSYSGTPGGINITLQVLDLKTMRKGGAVSASGPLSFLSQMENELAFNLISNAGLDPPVSREAFKKRTRTVPNSAFAALIASLESTNEEDQVLALRRAVNLHPSYSEAQFRLGRYYYDSGDCESAIRYLEPARRRPARYLESQFLLGVCYLKKDLAAEAARSFASIVSARPSAAALNNLAVAELRRGDYAVAAEHLLEAQRLSRSDPAVLLNLAILRYLQGNVEAARSLLEQADALQPNRPRVLYLLSGALEACGETEKADEALARARQLGADPAALESEDPRRWCRLSEAFDQR